MEFKIPVPWGHIAAKSFGSWNGSPVLGLHDWEDNCETFSNLVPLLSRDFYFVLIDLPGHGLSSHLPKGMNYHKVDMVPIVKRIVDHQKWKNISILGHGYGAEIGLLYAVSNPTTVKGLILLNSTTIKSYPKERGFALENAAIIDQSLEEEAAEVQNKEYSSYDELVQELLSMKNEKLSDDAVKLLMKRGAKQNPENGTWTFTHDTRLKFPDLLKFSYEQTLAIINGLKKPISILILQGPKKSIIDPVETMFESQSLSLYRRLCTKFELHECSGKYAHLEEPKSLVENIQSFLNSLYDD